MDKTKKPANDIRVSFNSRIGGIVSYCEKLLKENNMRELTFSAVGGSIGTLVSVVELLKTIYPGLYQVNRLATISYQSVEEGSKSEAQNQRLYPKLEIKLTLDKPKPSEGFQEKLTEEERKKLLDLHNKRREDRRQRGARRRPFGRGRPRRGGFRGRRGGFRGRRPFSAGPPRRGVRGRGRATPRGRGRGRPAPRGTTRGGANRGRGAPRGRGTQNK